LPAKASGTQEKKPVSNFATEKNLMLSNDGLFKGEYYSGMYSAAPAVQSTRDHDNFSHPYLFSFFVPEFLML
jgi:hypothetical protein